MVTSMSIIATLILVAWTGDSKFLLDLLAGKHP